MDCKEAEEQLVPYILGSLESSEALGIDRHVAACPDCGLRLRREGAIVADLAYAVPQVKVPARVKRRLFARIRHDSLDEMPSDRVRAWSGLLADLGLKLAARSGLAVTSLLVVVMVLGEVWFNSRLNQIAEEKEALAAQIATVTDSEAEMIDRWKAQHDLIQMAAAPGTTVKTLSASETTVNASAFIVVEATGMEGTLTAIDMPQLPAGKVYQVWLVKDGGIYDTGAVFTVDSTGYGQTDIVLTAPLSEFDAMIITVESEGGSADPTSESVLKGDL